MAATPLSDTTLSPCALVVMAPGEPSAPEFAVVIFRGAKDAEEFAVRHRYPDWRVVPLGFTTILDQHVPSG